MDLKRRCDLDCGDVMDEREGGTGIGWFEEREVRKTGYGIWGRKGRC